MEGYRKIQPHHPIITTSILLNSHSHHQSKPKRNITQSEAEQPIPTLLNTQRDLNFNMGICLARTLNLYISNQYLNVVNLSYQPHHIIQPINDILKHLEMPHMSLKESQTQQPVFILRMPFCCRLNRGV